jgi:hypothetical protein
MARVFGVLQASNHGLRSANLASSEGDERSWIGSLSGSVEIVGDVISPVIDIETIEALKH